ncbi:PAS domain S-box protein [Roseisolibacter agri]|uniref:histidine kinase n=1 Tax=Roseisolibacter agri TaxID=2014610 RepID=A0AA37Q254_9BACT|nr:PAS domain S-box protein [Roseisolibacter agri]GLC25189.1 hypothetical protein rosag_17020 [Roseisolibacter agri]
MSLSVDPPPASAPARTPADRLLAALGSAADGVLVVDRDGACHFATPRALELLGAAPGTLETTPDWDAWPATAREAVGPAVSGAATTGRPTQTRTCPAYQGPALVVRASPAGDALLVTVTALADDPPDREAATTLDRLPDVVLRYDREGVIRYVNAAIVGATGQPQSHFLGKRAGTTGAAPEISARFAAARERVFATGQPETFEIRRVGERGDRCIEYRMAPERDASGAIVTALAIGRDVTDQVALATALRESQRRMATLLSNLPGMAYRMVDDARWTTEFVSEGVLALTGYAPEAFEGADGVSFESLIHPDDRGDVRDQVNDALEQGRPFAITYRIVRADGVTRWVWEQGREVPHDGAGPRMLEGLIVDVTDREEARVALEAERERLQEAQRIAHVGSWEIDFVHGRHVVSDEILRVLGTGPETRDDPLGTFAARLRPEDREALRAREARIRALRPTHTEGRYVIERPDGVQRVVQMRSAWTFDAEGVLVRGRGTLQDVTDVVEGEARLARQQALLEESQRLAHVGSWEWDRRTDALTWSDEMFRLVGLPLPPAASPRRFAELVHADDLELVLERFREGLATGRTLELEHRLVRADGTAITVHARTRMITDDTGRVVRVVGSVQDVSEHRAAQAALRLSQEQQLALLQSIPDAAWLKDIEGRYVALNESAWRARGLGAADVLGRTAAELFPPDVVAERLAHDRAVLESGGPVLIEHQETGPDGAPRWYETVKAPYRDAAGSIAGTVGIARDITGRRRLEEQVRQSQKMDALGLLAGSVAHDFNNLLSAIIGGTELARLEVPDDSQLAQDLDDVRHAAQRGAQLTRQLLAFSRTQVSQPRPIDLREQVRESAKLLRRLLPEDVALDVAVDDAPFVVRADAGQLEQVLMNLVVNARDAVLAKRAAAHGRPPDPDAAPDLVTIAASRRALAAGDPLLVRRGAPALPPGGYALLVVRDSGNGMDEPTLRRAFEPFFTTKPQGRGTGLGLATVLGIVEQSGGAVHVESAPGAGATFTVVLPLVEGPADVVAVGTRTALPGGTETVLLVEDEGAVRETAARILERHGYRVLATRHGGDALMSWADHGARVDVVVTDLRMPAVDGKTLVAHLRAEQPTLPIVVMSGYASVEDSDERLLLEREVFLAKPFSAETLLEQVRAALDRAPSRTG